MGAGSSSNPWAGTGSPSTGRPTTCAMWSSWRTASRPPPWGSAWCTPSGASWTENETCARWWTSWRRCWTGRGWRACARTAPACPSWPGQGGRRFSPASTGTGGWSCKGKSLFRIEQLGGKRQSVGPYWKDERPGCGACPCQVFLPSMKKFRAAQKTGQAAVRFLWYNGLNSRGEGAV